MTKRGKIVLFLTPCLCSQLYAAGVTGNYYADLDREIFLLPKSAAMAGSDMTVTRSAVSFSNPAGLAADSIKEISLAYAGYLQNSYSTSVLSYVGPVDNVSCIGISASYILVPGIEFHDDTIVPVNVPVKSSSDLFVRISYGRKILQFGKKYELSAGVAVNTERRNLIGWTGYGIGTDAGINLSCYFKEIASVATAGVVVENLTTSFTYWSSEYKEYSYPHMRLGLGWQQDIRYLYGKLSLSYLSPDLFSNEGINHYGSESLDGTNDIERPAVQRVATHPLMLFLGARGGIEYSIMNTISFRVGIKQGSMSFGGGLYLFHNHAGFDFAYLDHQLAPTYKLSVNFRWF
jgi:hypothetical protein